MNYMGMIQTSKSPKLIFIIGQFIIVISKKGCDMKKIFLTLPIVLLLVTCDTNDGLTPQERRYNRCLETVYQGSGENKITLDSDKATPEDRLSMKKYCLCIADIEQNEKLLRKKLDAFEKKHKGTKISRAEQDVLEEEVKVERSKACNKQS